MTEPEHAGLPPEEEPDGLVDAFVHEVSEPARTRLGARLAGAGLAVAVIAGIAVGVGVLTQPHKAKPAAAAAAPSPTPAPQSSPAASPPQAPPAAPGGTATAPPVNVTVTQNVPYVDQRGTTPPAGSAAAGSPTARATGPSSARPVTSSAPPPASKPAPSASHPAATGPTATFGAVTGYGCPQVTGAASTVAGWFTQGSQGFVSVARGGWGHVDNCNGSFAAMPMSGKAGTDDPQNWAAWTFRPGTKVAFACEVSVFIPNDSDITHVGGKAAHYEVFTTSDASGANVGTFTIDQTAHRNTWVDAGRFPATGGTLTVKLFSRGDDGTTNAHLAVNAMKVACAG